MHVTRKLYVNNGIIVNIQTRCGSENLWLATNSYALRGTEHLGVTFDMTAYSVTKSIPRYTSCGLSMSFKPEHGTLIVDVQHKRNHRMTHCVFSVKESKRGSLRI